MREKLINALQARLPDVRINLIERYVDKYINAVMQEITHQYPKMTAEDIEAGEMNFAADKVTNAAGRAKINGISRYIVSLMHEDPKTSLVIDRYVGNSISKRISRVCININFKKEIMDRIQEVPVELDVAYLDTILEKANVRVPVDPNSLRSYIEHTTLSLPKCPAGEYRKKLEFNLKCAERLLAQVEQDAVGYYVCEYWEEISSGRIHGHGLSLQCISKEIRHAALGYCYQYDFKAASYALMTSMAMELDPSIKVAALKNYIVNRSTIRKRIATDVGISEEWMKGVFTSLGFGAELKDNPFSTIRRKLGSEKYQKLLSNSEFMQIADQLRVVSNTICNHVGKGDFEWLGSEYTEINPKDGKKRTKNQLLAWIYQRMESDAMNLMLGLIPDGYRVLLTVHDGVYLDKPLPSGVVVDIKIKLRQRYSLLDFAGSHISPIHAPAYVSDTAKAYEHEQLLHRARLEEEERLAEEYHQAKVIYQKTISSESPVWRNLS